MAVNWGVLMTKYIISRCKNQTWIMALVIILGSINAILGNYIYKFIGFVIDYGLNYTGTPYSGELAFLFTGKFGDYGSMKLIITLCVGMVLCALISYLSILFSCYVQKRAQNHIANKYRIEIFKKSKGKVLPISSGDMMVILNEDIYEVSNTFISYYSAIISSVLSIGYTIFMLNSISPYLLIAPIALTPLLLYFTFKYHSATYKENQVYRKIDGELKETIAQITGSESVESYETFEIINEKHTVQRKIHSTLGNRYSTILNIIKIMIYIISCTVAGVLAIQGKVLIGEYLIFTTFINTIYAQLISLINNCISIRSAQPRIEKVKNLMEDCLNEA